MRSDSQGSVVLKENLSVNGDTWVTNFSLPLLSSPPDSSPAVVLTRSRPRRRPLLQRTAPLQMQQIVRLLEFAKKLRVLPPQRAPMLNGRRKHAQTRRAL